MAIQSRNFTDHRATVLAFLDFFIPSELSNTRQGMLTRSRFVVGVALVGCVISLGLAAVDLWLSLYTPALVLMISAVLLTGVPVLLRATGSVNLTVTAAILILLGASWSISWSQGGFVPIILVWHILVPVLMLFLSDIRLAMIWTLVVIVELTAIYVMDLNGLAPPGSTYFTETSHMTFGFMSIVSLIVVTMYIAVGTKLVHQRSEEARVRLEGQLAQSRRLASLSSMAGGMAHEINSPLFIILNNLDYCRDTFADADEAGLPLQEMKAALSDAREGGRRIRDIVQWMRKMSDEEGGVEDVDITSVLESSIKMAHHEIRPRARLVRSGEPVPSVEGSPNELGQVFFNLLINAAQAIEAGRPEANQIVVMTSVAGDEVRVDVRDTGEGIGPEVAEHMFDPFFSTKHDCLGMGLSLARKTITRLGGTIELVPESNHTCLRVALPVSGVSSFRRV